MMQEDRDFSLLSLEALTLTGVEVFGSPEAAGIDAITFDFSGKHVSVAASPDANRLMWFDGPVFPMYENQVRKSQAFWRGFYGMLVIWSWKMVNQRGCQDAAQFMFGPGGWNGIAQVMARDSAILVFSMTEQEPIPRPSPESAG